MIQRILGSAAVAAFFTVVCTPAYADIIELRDGSFRPKSVELRPGDIPGFDMLKATKNIKAEPGYDYVKIGRDNISAAQVRAIYSSEAALNSDFNAGETHGASQNYEEAAASFEMAAEALKTASGKQTALYKAMVAWQATGARNLAAMLTAADALIAAAPKGYYVPAANMLRARIFTSQGKTKDAAAALDAITTATGMNARDFFEAELTKADWYQLRKAGKDVKKLAAVEKAYRNLAKQAKGKGRDAEIQALKARVRAGRALVYQGKYADARADFEAVTNAKDVHDQALLGSAYSGLGDAVYGQAKLDDKSTGGDEAKKQAVYDALTTAALHYLRVTELYGDDWAPDEVLSATQNLARVFANQFAMGGSKDCKLGKRAYAYYRAAWQRMSRGEPKTLLAREATEFKKQFDAACKK